MQDKIDDLAKHIYELRSEFGVVKSDSQRIYNILDRVNSALEKLSDSYNKVASESTLANQRLLMVEKFEENFDHIMEKHNEKIERQAEKLSKRIDLIEKWVWVMTGGGVVVGFIVQNAVKWILG